MRIHKFYSWIIIIYLVFIKLKVYCNIHDSQ